MLCLSTSIKNSCADIKTRRFSQMYFLDFALQLSLSLQMIETMKFTYGTFSCDVAFYVMDETFGRDAFDIDILPTHNPLHLIARFYDASRVQVVEKIRDFTAVDRGYGTITLNMIDKEIGLMSGYLDANVFTTREMIKAAGDFVKEQLPNWRAREGYIPYHICSFKSVDFVEYTGE